LMAHPTGWSVWRVQRDRRVGLALSHLRLRQRLHGSRGAESPERTMIGAQDKETR
jgi:hypothetical protein